MVTIEQMRAAEAGYVAAGGCLEELTEQVGESIANFLEEFYPRESRVIAYLGKGNNALDALIAIRHLNQRGWDVAVRLGFAVEEFSDKGRIILNELDYREMETSARAYVGQSVFLDALVGIGAEGELRSPLKELAEEMNQRRARGEGKTVSIDLPSGLDGDSGEVFPGAVQADVTLAVGAVKVGLVEERAVNAVGRLVELRMPGLACEQVDEVELLTSARLSERLPVRDFDTHKGMAGRVGILMGQEGMRGATNLCSEASLLAGAGLVTVFGLPGETALMESIKIDEVMVKTVKCWPEIADENLDVLVLGPGMADLDQGQQADLWRLIRRTEASLVLDAGVLAMIGESGRWREIPASAVLTPHPGEMRRLFPDLADLGRKEQVTKALERTEACLILKGARTLVGKAGYPIGINTSGSPGMATAGQGDCLAGLVAGLMAGGVKSYEAATLGVWLAGRAGELASGVVGDFSLRAGDSLSQLPTAFQDLRNHRL